MKNTLIVILIFCTFISCKKNSTCCTVNDLSLFIKVSSANGQDLLNPTSPKSLTESDLMLFYKRDGKFEPFFDAKLDDERNLKIIHNPESNTYVLRLYVDYVSDKNDISTTLLRLGSLRTDTISTKISNSGSSKTILDVSINNEKVNRDNLTIVL